MKSLLWAVLGLALLDLALTSNLAIPKVAEGVAKWVSDWIDPTVPLITASPIQTSSTPANPTPIPVLGPNASPFPGPFPLPLPL